MSSSEGLLSYGVSALQEGQQSMLRFEASWLIALIAQRSIKINEAY